MRNFSTYFLLLSLFTLALAGCRKDEVYPLEPAIEFLDFQLFQGDSGIYRINFTDGDGDIGYQTEDTTKCLFLTYYYLDTITGTWRKDVPTINGPITIEFISGIPKADEDREGKALKGEIDVDLGPVNYGFTYTYKYKCYIIDRAGHKSNEVESQIIYP